MLWFTEGNFWDWMLTWVIYPALAIALICAVVWVICLTGAALMWIGRRITGAFRG